MLLNLKANVFDCNDLAERFGHAICNHTGDAGPEFHHTSARRRSLVWLKAFPALIPGVSAAS